VPELRLIIKRGDKIRIPDDHPQFPGKEGIVIFCGAYQARVRVIDEPRETWVFSNDCTILEG
jgi:hypothetical protein